MQNVCIVLQAKIRPSHPSPLAAATWNCPDFPAGPAQGKKKHQWSVTGRPAQALRS